MHFTKQICKVGIFWQIPTIKGHKIQFYGGGLVTVVVMLGAVEATFEEMVLIKIRVQVCA